MSSTQRQSAMRFVLEDEEDRGQVGISIYNKQPDKLNSYMK